MTNWYSDFKDEKKEDKPVVELLVGVSIPRTTNSANSLRTGIWGSSGLAPGRFLLPCRSAPTDAEKYNLPSPQTFDEVEIREGSDIAVHISLGVRGYCYSPNRIDSRCISRHQLLP